MEAPRKKKTTGKILAKPRKTCPRDDLKKKKKGPRQLDLQGGGNVQKRDWIGSQGLRKKKAPRDDAPRNDAGKEEKG